MIVEHTFVTTLEGPDAFSVAESILASLRFAPEPAESGASRRWKRGARSFQRARGQADLPTRVRMDFDRGRVVLAASVDARRRPPRLAALLAVGVTLALERALAHGHDPVESRADCEQIDRRMRVSDAWRFFTGVAVIGFLGVAFVGLIVLAAAMG